jgi:predicted regulator of Ras-like GTPase activity (Roadblock/LC7/MglB family)
MPAVADRIGKGRRLVFLKSLLEELVSRVKGATGAIIIEGDGEAVQWYSELDGERLRLRGAYVALMLQACRSTNIRASLGDMDSLVIGYDVTTLIARRIDDECFLILELKSSANLGEALFRLEPVSAKIKEEIRG